MLKENGRLKPADKKELANLKNKTNTCTECGKEIILENASFASNTCPECGNLLREDNKITGDLL